MKKKKKNETEHLIHVDFFLKGYFQVIFVKQANSILSIDSSEKTKQSAEQNKEEKKTYKCCRH